MVPCGPCELFIEFEVQIKMSKIILYYHREVNSMSESVTIATFVRKKKINMNIAIENGKK